MVLLEPLHGGVAVAEQIAEAIAQRVLALDDHLRSRSLLIERLLQEVDRGAQTEPADDDGEQEFVPGADDKHRDRGCRSP